MGFLLPFSIMIMSLRSIADVPHLATKPRFMGYIFGFSGKMGDNIESLRIQLHANLTTKSALWESVAQNIFPVETRTRSLRKCKRPSRRYENAISSGC